MKYIIIILIVVFSCTMAEAAIYNRNYLIYDEYGLKKVNCMRCNVVIRKRGYKLLRKEEGKDIYTECIKTLSNFANVPVDLNNGSWTNILMCRDCEKIYQPVEEELTGMANQLKNGWADEARGLRKSIKEISAIKNRVKHIQVLRPHIFKKDAGQPVRRQKIKKIQRRQKIKENKK